MPREGFADPVTNDGIGFLSNMPISELTECVTRAIKASDINSTPPVVETTDGATITKMSRSSTEPLLCGGARGKLDLQGDRMRGRKTISSDPREGVRTNIKDAFSY